MKLKRTTLIKQYTRRIVAVEASGAHWRRSVCEKARLRRVTLLKS